jgi:hypothetical protein
MYLRDFTLLGGKGGEKNKSLATHMIPEGFLYFRAVLDIFSPLF